jgi:hypothetical protein
VQGLYANLDDLGLGVLHGVDLILCCLDSFAARLVAHEQAWRLGVPWVDAALDGSGTRLYGRVVAYNPLAPQAPCMLCPWDEATYRQALAAQAGQGCPTWLNVAAHRQEALSTLAISALAGIIAGLQTIQAVRLLLGDRSVAGHELTIDVPHALLHMTALFRAPRCRFDHGTWHLHALEAGADAVHQGRNRPWRRRHAATIPPHAGDAVTLQHVWRAASPSTVRARPAGDGHALRLWGHGATRGVCLPDRVHA